MVIRTWKPLSAAKPSRVLELHNMRRKVRHAASFLKAGLEGIRQNSK